MKVTIREVKIIPTQSIVDKVSHVAVMNDVYYCDEKGKRTDQTSENPAYVGVNVENLSGKEEEDKHSIILDSKNFAKLYSAYHVPSPAELVSHAVIAVYSNDKERKLTGLVPLGLEARITLSPSIVL